MDGFHGNTLTDEWEYLRRETIHDACFADSDNEEERI